jgi:hypothetical protein
MGINNNKNWAYSKGYYHHSQPSTPDYYTFFQKGIMRPALSNALKVISDETDGDKTQAETLLQQSGYYRDIRNKIQYNDNINMCSGRAVEYYCDLMLIEGAMQGEAYREALNVLTSLHTGSWIDQDKTKAQIEGRQLNRYNDEGKALRKNDEIGKCEFELVCENAQAGLREAMQGANQIIGQTELRGKLPGCELDYLGYGDYQEGAVELKTQWDTGVDTDKPRSNSLPKEIKQMHLLQLAGYWNITGKIPRIVYANRLGYVVFEATIDQLEYALQDVTAACMRREKLMMVTDSVEQLLKLCDPHFGDSFVWRDLHPDVLRRAKTLAGVTR